MALDPRMSAYEIRYQPMFESTQQEIERSLFSIQEKLRRRKQIDLQLQLQRPIDFEEVNYYDAFRDLEMKERAHRSILEEKLHLQQIADDTQRLVRLEQLRRERNSILAQPKRQNAFSVPSANYGSPAFRLSFPSDQELIRKYQDGSKAKEYYKDLQGHQNTKAEAQIRQARAQPEKKSIEKGQLMRTNIQKHQFYTDRKANQLGENNDDVPKQGEFTPYDYLQQPAKSQKKQIVDSKQKEGSPVAKKLEKEFNQIQKKHSQSVTKLPSAIQSTQRTNSPLKLLNEPSVHKRQTSPYRQKMNHYQSLGKIPCNRSRSNLSFYRPSALDSSYVRSKEIKPEAKPSMKQCQFGALKKIENRLRTSKIIYEDSRFSNSKYEGNHLFNTFDMELKCRRDVKDKINNHPFVLHKHAMVVD